MNNTWQAGSPMGNLRLVGIPRRGTLNTTVWYSQYHGVVLPVPRLGTRRTKPRRKSGTAHGGKQILVRSNSVQSLKHLVMSGLYCHIINEIAIAILEQFA